MPITLAHPAAVLPLRGLGLPMTVLVAASMVPDIPLFLRWREGYELTHSLLGVLVVDVVLAVGVAVVWSYGVRDAVVDMAPTEIRARLPERARLTRRQWLLAPLAGCAGAATHAGWDSFTHPGRWGPRHIEWLRADHVGLEGLRWAQYVSGVVGLTIVVWAAVRHLRSLQPLPEDRGPAALPSAVLPATLVASGLVGVAAAAVHAPQGFHVTAFWGVVGALIAFVLLVGVACVAWHLARRRHPVRTG